MLEHEDYDVAIVGYGPVGAIFANLLTRYGLRIAVIDQAADVYDKPRAITLDHEALRIFQACGLGAFMDGAVAAHNGSHYLGVDRGVIKKFDPLPPPYPLGWFPTATFVQPDAERALRDKLATYDAADVLLSTSATAMAQDQEGVSLTVASSAGDERVVRARYLVGADGANSFVRKQLGVPLEDLAFDEWWMVVDALTSDPAKRPSKSFQYCWPSRPGTFVPGPGALKRWEIKLLPGEDPHVVGAPDNVLNLLKGYTDTSDLTIWRSAVYRFHALLARRWRAGRILMMGDAVHQTPPFLGQGLCAGVRDAANLAWKIALVLRGNAHESLLDSYETERMPHVRSIVARAKEFGLIIGELDPAAAQARDVRLREELNSGKAQTIRQKFIPDLAGGIIMPGAKLAGSLFVQPHARRDGSPAARLDDLMTPEFAIVAATPDVLDWLSPQSRAIWDRIRGERVVIGTTPANQVSDGVKAFVETEMLFADWLRHNGITAAIVRPDRYVFAGAASADELNALVGKLAEMLEGNAG